MLVRLAICSLLGLSSIAHAACEDIVKSIFTHAVNAIERVEDGNIFLHASYIYLDDGRIYLESAEAPIELPGIHTAGPGLYSIKQDALKKYWRCVSCSQIHRQEERPTICDRCGKKEFFFYYE